MKNATHVIEPAETLHPFNLSKAEASKVFDEEVAPFRVHLETL